MEDKTKTDINSVIARANAQAESMKKSVTQTGALTEDYKVLPKPFSKYEINTKDVIRSVSSKVTIGLKKGTGKYYLANDGGVRKLISLEEIRRLVPAKQKAEVIKNDKKDKPVKEKTEVRKLEHLPADVKEILGMEISNYIKSYKLHKLGYTNDEIAVYTNVKKGSVSRDIWLVNQGHRPMPK